MITKRISALIYYLQALSEGLRSNQTIAELNLCGCKLTDEAVKVLASIIKVCSQDNIELPCCQDATEVLSFCDWQCMTGDELAAQLCTVTLQPTHTTLCTYL